LAGLEGPTPLPADRGPGAAPEIRQDRIQLSAETTAALQALGRSSRLTLNTLLQGAWALLLARTSGNPEVVFGATVSGRPAELPGIESMVGLFINSLPVHTAVPPQARLLDWLGELQDRQTAARQHEHVPLVDIQGWSPVPRGTPLFESLVVFENYPAEEALSEGGGPGLQVDGVDSHETTHYPLVLIAVPGPRLTLRLFWDRSRFSAESIQRVLCGLATICEAMARRPEAPLAEVDPLPEGERHQLLVEWNDTAGPEAGASLHSLFEAQAKRQPDAVAITTAEESVTYGELHRRASALAHHLRALGVGPEIRVALGLERTPDLVVAMLGVLAAGGAYVPLDLAYPRERLAFLLADSGASLLVTERHLESLLPEGAPRRLWLAEEPGSGPAGFPAVATDPENLAYLIYTSGSTGRPKGVAIAHRSAAALVCWTRSAFSDAELDGVLASTSVCFDLSVFELLATLCLGGRVVLAAQALELPALAAAGVRLVNTVPSVLAELARASKIPPSVTTVCLAGEPLPKALVQEIEAQTTAERVLNLYGPSEDTTYSTWAAAHGEGREPAIGRPISGTRAYVLDSELRPVPLEAAGELCLAGTGLARGYLGRPDLTARQFVPSPFGGPGERLYRTGDLARFRPDGNLDFLGRIDQQVKIRGFRIELGEIEAALREEGAVREAAVAAIDHPALGKSLVAYVVLAEEVSTESLRQALSARLPQSMVPAAFVVLPALPLNRNGKVDRKALAQIAPGTREERGLVEPQGHVERTVAAVWCEILGLDQVGRHQSFFDLGGHSLLLVRAQGRLAEELGREISLVDLFRYPTVSALAGFLEPGAPAPAPRRRALPAQSGRIAVIGLAGRFPGASGVDAFWQNLAAGVESIAFHTEAELEADGVEPTVRSSPHFVPAGGVLEGIELSDAPFFGYTPRDAEIADPQHRLFLECAWEALESAGYVPETCPGPVGVFAGASRSQYFWNLISNPEVL
ncbi:MAG TPA: amino acid adenylation domain-containing protein, partial [Thermoanaerobaculia bacterium]|nr:amino acid adenylation domain-containing protein [Thermoanaerobaculia bacterium]